MSVASNMKGRIQAIGGYTIFLGVVAGSLIIMALVMPSIYRVQLDVIKSVTGLELQGFGAFIGNLLFVSLAMVVLVGITSLLWIRWRKPSVFVSFKGQYQEVADHLALALKENGFKVLMIPYKEDGYTHDEVVGRVRDLLREADAMITLPHPSEASFVNDEIMGASVLSVPITIFNHQPSQVLPASSFTGYAVFKYNWHQDGLASAKQLQPLMRYFEIVTRHPRDITHFILRMLKTIFQLQSLVVAGGVAIFCLGVAFGNRILNFIDSWLVQNFPLLSFGQTNEDQDLMEYLLGILFLGLLLAFALALSKAVQIQRIARQDIITGKASFEKFTEVFSESKHDKVILDGLVWSELVEQGKVKAESKAKRSRKKPVG